MQRAEKQISKIRKVSVYLPNRRKEEEPPKIVIISGKEKTLMTSSNPKSKLLDRLEPKGHETAILHVQQKALNIYGICRPLRDDDNRILHVSTFGIC